MASSNENNPGVIGPGNFHEGIRAGKISTGISQGRRALSNIDWNVIGDPYPSAITKRGLTEKHAIRAKNPPIPVHRPITRNFAAQMSNKQQLKPEVTKKQVHSVPTTSGLDDSAIVVDDDDYETMDDFSAPMYVQHAEAMLEEIDRMDEVEMEDVDDEPVLDINSSDKKNALAAVEYIEDLYQFYKKSEWSSRVPPNYMDHQLDINDRMRGILIDWLIEVHYKFELMEETLYLTVNLIDRFLSVQQITRKKLQLVGATAMLLACKYEEVSVPVVDDLIIISDHAYSRKEVLDMEKMMVNTLQFNMSVPTTYVFMRRFLKAAESDKNLELLAFFLIELCLVEYQMLEYPPSLLAAAAVYTAQCAITRTQQWSKTCELHTSYSEDQLLGCARAMVGLHQKCGTGKLAGVHRKYNTSKLGYTARTEPANFILNSRF
ncbi:hypothetical protein MLD38_035024 [Melastoma candidum]|uniref:Uncharacterized protein n=1 Tax=Melastoma candidum TaxID=119954 RepID=A0ACB9MBS1_9MYRT|nr:hypothetical protein MLD38_035024 [Melastoma candidum]